MSDYSFLKIIEDDIIEICFEFIVVISQDCDLSQVIKNNKIKENQYLPNILFLPAFPAEKLRSGEHLEKVYHIRQDRINSDKWKILKQNNNERYHFIKNDVELQIPDLVMDFKTYHTIPIKNFIKKHKENYKVTINEIFREQLSQRFSTYLSRIGIPELEINNITQ